MVRRRPRSRGVSPPARTLSPRRGRMYVTDVQTPPAGSSDADDGRLTRERAAPPAALCPARRGAYSSEGGFAAAGTVRSRPPAAAAAVQRCVRVAEGLPCVWVTSSGRPPPPPPPRVRGCPDRARHGCACVLEPRRGRGGLCCSLCPRPPRFLSEMPLRTSSPRSRPLVPRHGVFFIAFSLLVQPTRVAATLSCISGSDWTRRPLGGGPGVEGKLD